MMYIAYVLWGLAGLYALVLLCSCNRIRLGLAIMETTAKFVGNTPTIFLVPILFVVVVLIFFFWWIITALYVFSVGDLEKKIGTPMATVKWNDTTRYIFVYHLFGLLWCLNFFIGCTQFVLAVAASTWYFSHSGDTAGSGSIWLGIKWIARYHFGSIAFGAFIIAVV